MWIDAKKLKPYKDGVYLIVMLYPGAEMGEPCQTIDIAIYTEKHGWTKAYPVTHWQPLPELPEDKE